MKLKSALLLFLLSIFNLYCGQQKNEEKITQDKQYFNSEVNDLKVSMIEYLESSNPSYTKDDVEECVSILNNYLEKISKTKSKKEGIDVIKSTVIQLNKLNNKTQNQLIETMEREMIVSIILTESNKKGYNRLEEDLTEKFREW
jgi:hypothetical protein